ncbi:ribonuclease H-like domain-containing protein [Rhizophagus irregularis DAOM 181602=DAOM 197198]|nr:ribonuclease H-like domain-containing protein [Rhizophagus irregularis DAOM 181602=DAOM 197198]
MYNQSKEKLKINISSQSYMNNVTWITKNKAQLEQILKIAGEFNIMNNIQTNYDKFEMITNKKLDKDIVEVNFRSSKRMVKPLTSKESVRILGVWINLDLKTNYVFNQCKDIIKRYNKTISFKQITDLQMKYIYNHVIIPRVDYKAQLKASLPLTTPNSIIHSLLGYAIKDINTIQAQRQLSRLYNQMISKGVMKDIFEVDCKQLQSELLFNKSPLAIWNISLKDLQVKHYLLACVLALLYDNMLTIKSSGVKVNQIQGGLIPIVEICTHKEIFTKGISKELKGKNVYFASQLMSSDGTCLLRYKDLKHRTKINTQGRIPSWFKFIETKLIEAPLKSKKVKTDYQLGYNIHSVDIKIDNLKTKNWITTFHDKPIIGRVLDNSNEDKICIEHWIQDLENDQISPSVQLPILKKCGRCEVKMNQIRNKKSNIKVRFITDINIENCVKINANLIQNNCYIADMAIYEALAQAECKYYRKTSINECIIKKVNGLFKYIHPSDYRNVLIEIANSLTQETDIEIYTDGSMKNVATSEILIDYAFVINAPIKKSFNCEIVDNLSSNKTELMAVILSLMICPKAANVEIYSDFQWIIRIYSLKVKIIKVKAHGDCDYNKEADKLTRSGAEKNVLIIEDKLLLHNGTICWRDMLIECNPILTIKGIKDVQFIEEFLMLRRNKVYRQSDLLRLIDWKISLKLNNINQYDTLFEDHYLQSFKIKICCNELPTCANLKKLKFKMLCKI